MDKFDLLKSHIEAYTRKDGTVVNAHDDKRIKKLRAEIIASGKADWHQGPEHHAAVKDGFKEDHDVDVSESEHTMGDSSVRMEKGDDWITHGISPRTGTDGKRYFAVNGHAKVKDKRGAVTSAKMFPTIKDAVTHVQGVHAKWREAVK